MGVTVNIPDEIINGPWLKDYLDDLELLYTPIGHDEADIESTFKTEDAMEYIKGLGNKEAIGKLPNRLILQSKVLSIIGG